MAEEKKLKEDITKSKVHTRPEPSTSVPERELKVQVEELKVFKFSPSIITRQDELIIFMEMVRQKINEIIRSL